VARADLTDGERRFAEAALRRRRLFLILSVLGVVVAAALTAYYAYRRVADPDYPLGIRLVMVLLILLNARQNLRQYRYASVLDKIKGTDLFFAGK
jgi:hypothetical protein